MGKSADYMRRYRASKKASSADVKTSEETREVIFQNAMKSNVVGIRKKAENGTGNYAWKNYNAVSIEQAENMTQTQIIERTVDGVQYSVVTGIIDNKEAFVAGKSSDSRIKNLVDNLKKSNQEKSERVAKQQEEDRRKVAGSDKRTTTTYDRWRKRNQANFEAYWFGQGKKQK